MNDTQIDETYKQQTLTKTIVNESLDKFILIKTFQKSIGVISPFTKLENKFTSNFIVPRNRIHRIDEAIDTIPYSSSYELDDSDENSNIEFDCIEEIDKRTDIFKQHRILKEGIFHFDMTISKDNKVICGINPRLLISFNIEPREKKLEFDKIIEFKTNKIKIFSIIMTKGFIVCIANKESTNLFLTINNPKNTFVGNSLSENIKMLKNINLLWPFFIFRQQKSSTSIHIKKKYLNNIIHDWYDEYKYPIFMKFERNLKEESFKVLDIGKSLYIR